MWTDWSHIWYICAGVSHAQCTRVHIHTHINTQQQHTHLNISSNRESSHTIHLRRYLRSIEAIQWSQGHRRRLGDQFAYFMYYWAEENRLGRERFGHNDTRRIPYKDSFLKAHRSVKIGMKALHEFWRIQRSESFEPKIIRNYREKRPLTDHRSELMEIQNFRNWNFLEFRKRKIYNLLMIKFKELKNI